MAMRALAARRPEWSGARLVPALSSLVLAFASVLPMRVPDYATVAPLLALAGVYHWTIYRPELLPPTAVFLVGIVLDLLSGAPLGVSPLSLLLSRSLVQSQRRFFVNRLFPFVWSGFTLLAGVAVAFLWLLGGLVGGAVLDFRPAVLQWVLTVASFPAISYILMRVQRILLPNP